MSLFLQYKMKKLMDKRAADYSSKGVLGKDGVIDEEVDENGNNARQRKLLKDAEARLNASKKPAYPTPDADAKHSKDKPVTLDKFPKDRKLEFFSDKTQNWNGGMPFLQYKMQKLMDKRAAFDYAAIAARASGSHKKTDEEVDKIDKKKQARETKVTNTLVQGLTGGSAGKKPGATSEGIDKKKDTSIGGEGSVNANLTRSKKKFLDTTTKTQNWNGGMPFLQYKAQQAEALNRDKTAEMDPQRVQISLDPSVYLTPSPDQEALRQAMIDKTRYFGAGMGGLMGATVGGMAGMMHGRGSMTNLFSAFGAKDRMKREALIGALVGGVGGAGLGYYGAPAMSEFASDFSQAYPQGVASVAPSKMAAYNGYNPYLDKLAADAMRYELDPATDSMYRNSVPLPAEYQSLVPEGQQYMVVGQTMTGDFIVEDAQGNAYIFDHAASNPFEDGELIPLERNARQLREDMQAMYAQNQGKSGYHMGFLDDAQPQFSSQFQSNPVGGALMGLPRNVNMGSALVPALENYPGGQDFINNQMGISNTPSTGGRVAGGLFGGALGLAAGGLLGGLSGAIGSRVAGASRDDLNRNALIGAGIGGLAGALGGGYLGAAPGADWLAQNEYNRAIQRYPEDMLSESMNPYGSEDPAELERIREIGNRAMSASYDMPYYDWVPGYEDALASARGMYNPYLDKTANYSDASQAGPWSGAGYGVQDLNWDRLAAYGYGNPYLDKLAISMQRPAAIMYNKYLRPFATSRGGTNVAGNYADFRGLLSDVLTNRPALANAFANKGKGGARNLREAIMKIHNSYATPARIQAQPGLANMADYVSQGLNYVGNPANGLV